MPELPEIETLVRELKLKTAGRVLSQLDIRQEAVLKTPALLLKSSLEGKSILTAGRVGKFLYLEWERGFRLWFHLGMTGQLGWTEAVQEDTHLHLVLSFEGTRERLWFRDIRKFGEVFMTEGAALPENLKRLGPDPFEISPDGFSALFRKRTGVIKNLLMNQTLLSGLGNIYVNESLHRAGIHPKRPAGRVSGSRIARLHHVIRAVLEEAISDGGSSIDDYIRSDGTRGRFQERHRVYGRAGERCRDCGTRIRRVQISGRSAFFCGHCQR